MVLTDNTFNNVARYHLRTAQGTRRRERRQRRSCRTRFIEANKYYVDQERPSETFRQPFCYLHPLSRTFPENAAGRNVCSEFTNQPESYEASFPKRFIIKIALLRKRFLHSCDIFGSLPIEIRYVDLGICLTRRRRLGNEPSFSIRGGDAPFPTVIVQLDNAQRLLSGTHPYS